MILKQEFLTQNPCYYRNTIGYDERFINFQKNGPKGLMLHSVGCPQPNASVFLVNWNRPSFYDACVHGFIDGDTGIAYQTLPWQYRGWHGGGISNDTHIGVEMCEPACIKYKPRSAEFTCSDFATARAVAQRTYNTAVELFAYLCKKFNLDPLKDGVIISHKEGHARGIATNHGDPEHLWKGLGMSLTMGGFRKDVYNKLHEEEIDMSRSDLIQLIKETTGATEFGHVQDVPNWWRDNIQKLLDADCINGGTPREKDDKDVNLTYTEAKILHVAVAYVDHEMAAVNKKLDEILAAIRK